MVGILISFLLVWFPDILNRAVCAKWLSLWRGGELFAFMQQVWIFLAFFLSFSFSLRLLEVVIWLDSCCLCNVLAFWMWLANASVVLCHYAESLL